MKSRSSADWGKEILDDLPNDRRCLIAVSGGRDSVALLHWLLDRGYHRLIVCHFEHGLRGRAGRSDARFVARLAEKCGLSVELGAADVAAVARERKQSIETAARQERLGFFERVGRRRRCRTVFLAHQADDQVETFLLNLFRGAAGRGLGAMRPRSRHGSLEIVRPLLAVWRSEIDAYVLQHRLKFRDDATNEELQARRNRVRHRIIPWLEKEFGRNIRSTIWRAASVLAEEEDLLETMTPIGLTKSEEMPVKPLRQLAPALQRRVVRQWLVQRGIIEIGFSMIEEVRGLLAGGAPARVNLSRDRHARRRAGRIFLE
ncbi:MAG TPA: tRNA lysidine(34) synthetase TilS [Chthoniobacterales bacterium]|jgi:tRNA(Ile)-lysidine synthase|nr:tRNA lysidine(34) synthetase TilS [Chthoniobacterales bacterium]